MQAQEKQYAAQMARRREAMKALRARDEAPLARPKGYDPNPVGRNKVSSKQASSSWANDFFFCADVGLDVHLSLRPRLLVGRIH